MQKHPQTVLISEIISHIYYLHNCPLWKQLYSQGIHELKSEGAQNKWLTNFRSFIFSKLFWIWIHATRFSLFCIFFIFSVDKLHYCFFCLWPKHSSSPSRAYARTTLVLGLRMMDGSYFTESKKCFEKNTVVRLHLNDHF